MDDIKTWNELNRKLDELLEWTEAQDAETEEIKTILEEVVEKLDDLSRYDFSPEVEN